MLSVLCIEALANCTVSNGVLRLPTVLSDDEYQEFRFNLRKSLLDGKIPFYKPIAVKVCSTKLQRVTNIDKDLDESYLGMIPQLIEAIIMPEEPVETVVGDWNMIDDKANRMFNTSRVIKSHSIPPSYLLYSKTFNSGPQYVSDFRYMVDKEKYGKNISNEPLKPLLKDSSPIVTISDNDIKSITLEMVFAQAAEEVTYMDIEKTIGNTKFMYLPVAQTYDLDSYLLISIMSQSNSEIAIGYKREIDESVLQAIFRNFGKRLLEDYEEQIKIETSPVHCFSTGNVDGMLSKPYIRTTSSIKSAAIVISLRYVGIFTLNVSSFNSYLNFNESKISAISFV